MTTSLMDLDVSDTTFEIEDLEDTSRDASDSDIDAFDDDDDKLHAGPESKYDRKANAASEAVFKIRYGCT